MDELPIVSIIIPAWNEREYIGSLFKSIKEINYPKSKIEIITIAGGEDGTYDLANNAYFGNIKTKVIEDTNLGKNGAIVEGIRRSSGEIIALVDADTVVSKEWLMKMVIVLQKDGLDVVSGNAYPLNNCSIISKSMIRSENCIRILNRIAAINGNATIVFKRSILSRINIDDLFPIEAIGADDYAFMIACIENGFLIGSRDIDVRTCYPETILDYIRDSVRWSSSHLRYIRKIGKKYSRTDLIKQLAVVLSGIILFSFPACLFNCLFGVLVIGALIILLVFALRIFTHSKNYLFTEGNAMNFLSLLIAHWISYACNIYVIFTKKYERTYRDSMTFRSSRH
ncbi:MAG: glycosyltransferase [Candidatus Thorarchaeota archaeon]